MPFTRFFFLRVKRSHWSLRMWTLRWKPGHWRCHTLLLPRRRSSLLPRTSWKQNETTKAPSHSGWGSWVIQSNNLNDKQMKHKCFRLNLNGLWHRWKTAVLRHVCFLCLQVWESLPLSARMIKSRCRRASLDSWIQEERTRAPLKKQHSSTLRKTTTPPAHPKSGPSGVTGQRDQRRRRPLKNPSSLSFKGLVQNDCSSRRRLQARDSRPVLGSVLHRWRMLTAIRMNRIRRRPRRRVSPASPVQCALEGWRRRTCPSLTDT